MGHGTEHVHSDRSHAQSGDPEVPARPRGDAEGNRQLRRPEEAGRSPLALRLFELDGVAGVFLGTDFVTVTKSRPGWTV